MLPGTGTWASDSDPPPPPAPVSRYVSTPPPPGRAPSLCPTPPGRRAQCTCSQGAEGWLQMRPARAGDRPRARGSVAGLRLARAATAPVGFGWEKMLGAGGLSRYNVPGSKPPPSPPPRFPARPVAGEESGRRDFLCQPSLNISVRSSKQKGSFQPSGFGVQGESFSCKLLCGFKGVCSIERKTERERERCCARRGDWGESEQSGAPGPRDHCLRGGSGTGRAPQRTPLPKVVQPSAGSPPSSPLARSPESEEGLALSLESTC